MFPGTFPDDCKRKMSRCWSRLGRYEGRKSLIPLLVQQTVCLDRFEFCSRSETFCIINQRRALWDSVQCNHTHTSETCLSDTLGGLFRHSSLGSPRDQVTVWLIIITIPSSFFSRLLRLPCTSGIHYPISMMCFGA